MSGGVPAGELLSRQLDWVEESDCPVRIGNGVHATAYDLSWDDVQSLRASPTPPPVATGPQEERVTPLDVLMDKRLIAEAAAKAMSPDRDLHLNPLYVDDPAWRIATAVQDAARAALQALGERG